MFFKSLWVKRIFDGTPADLYIVNVCELLTFNTFTTFYYMRAECAGNLSLYEYIEFSSATHTKVHKYTPPA